MFSGLKKRGVFCFQLVDNQISAAAIWLFFCDCGIQIGHQKRGKFNNKLIFSKIIINYRS